MIVVTGDPHTKLLLHGDSFIDGSKDKRVITNTGVAVSAAQSKFGDSSFYFNGSAYLTMPGYDFGTDDFTIDWWEYPTNANAGTRFTNVYCTSYATQAGGLLTHLYYSNSLQIWLSNKTGGASTSDWNVFAGETLGNNVVNTWTHRAVVRSGGSLMFFKNGTLEYTYNIGTNAVGYSSNRPWGIGNWASDYMLQGYSYIGYIAEFRVSDIARWTESFTPPTEPYPDSSIEILPGGTLPARHALRRRMMINSEFSFEYTGNYTDDIIGSNRVIKFTSSGTLTVTGVRMGTLYMLAGGGGAQYDTGYKNVMSGGGGGNLTISDFALSNGTYDLAIGMGGKAHTGKHSNGKYSGDGGDTTGFGYTCTGGTGGGENIYTPYGGTGGSPNGGNGSTPGKGILRAVAGGTPNGGSISNPITANPGGDGYITLTIPI